MDIWHFLFHLLPICRSNLQAINCISVLLQSSKTHRWTQQIQCRWSSEWPARKHAHKRSIELVAGFWKSTRIPAKVGQMTSFNGIAAHMITAIQSSMFSPFSVWHFYWVCVCANSRCFISTVVSVLYRFYSVLWLIPNPVQFLLNAQTMRLSCIVVGMISYVCQWPIRNGLAHHCHRARQCGLKFSITSTAAYHTYGSRATKPWPGIVWHLWMHFGPQLGGGCRKWTVAWVRVQNVQNRSCSTNDMWWMGDGITMGPIDPMNRFSASVQQGPINPGVWRAN